MRIGIIGANGQLGTDLVKAFRGHDVIPWTRGDFDVRDHERTREAILAARPDVVINTAAFHKTDACEDEPELAYAVNATAPRNLARACEASGATLVHLSTDFVFDGEKRSPYVESDLPQPLNVYGTTKLAGERLIAESCDRHYIVRVASLFGAAGSSGKGGNFVEAMRSKAKRGEPLTIVDDVTMSPTYTADAAESIRRLLEAMAPCGTYHMTNSGACTWFTFAAEILRQARLAAEVTPTTIAAMAPKARRPRYSALTSTRLPTIGLPLLRPWQEALAAYLEVRAVEAPV